MHQVGYVNMLTHETNSIIQT